MAVLTSKERNKMKKSTFGLPGERKYPMPDKAHAINAKARATQMEKKGKLSKSSKEKIDEKANKILHGEKKKLSHIKEKVEKVKTEIPKMNKIPRMESMSKHEKERKGLRPY